MSELPPTILSHVSIGVADVARAGAFYDRVFAPLQIGRVMEFPFAIAYGRVFPQFWVQQPYDGKPFSVGNGTHFAFLAADRAAVDAFHAAGLAAGGICDGPPGPRPLYSPAYYGAFLRDLDGHKIEAMYWDFALAGAPAG